MQEGGELVTVVYVDLVILVNFVMDFFILWAAGKLAGLRVKALRLICGALLGAAYSMIIFFPQTVFLTSFFAKVLCSIAMVLAAFAPLRLGLFCRSLASLYIVSFAMGGAVLAAMYMMDDPPQVIQVINGVAVYQEGYALGWLAAGIGAAVMVGYGGYVTMRNSWIRHNLIKTLTIHFGQGAVNVEALLDTGNHLYDPVSKNPVILVEAKTIAQLLPPALQKTVLNGLDDLNLADLTAGLNEEWAARLKVIPFSSVGRSQGLLLGFRPDLIEIQDRRQTIRRDDAVIGLINRALTKNGRYQALLHPELFRQIS